MPALTMATGRVRVKGVQVGDTGGSDGFDVRLAVRASRRYYVDGRSKVDIADELRLSRFKVARLLDEARSRGLVRIEIAEPDEHALGTAGRLRRRYGLEDALVVTTGSTHAETLGALGRRAAEFVATRLRHGDTLGLGWGTTVGAVVDTLAHVRRPSSVDVAQLAGGFASGDPAFNGTALTLRTAELLGGRPLLLHAPAVLESARAWTMLRRQPAVAETIAAYDRVRMAVTGVGALRPEPISAIYQGGVLGPDLPDRLARAGVVGDACCRFIDNDGATVPRFDARTSGMDLEQVHAVALRVAVAFGLPKLQAVRAALRSGLVNVLATDSATADALLDERDPASLP